MISIILTEDDEDDQVFFHEALKEINIKAELSIIHDGAELISTLVETVSVLPPPHIVFLDLNMPKKNGYECLKEIRETPKLKELPIVIFSTSNDRFQIEKTFTLGANCYIHKPISHSELKSLIESALALKLWENKKQLAIENYVLVPRDTHRI